MTPPNKKWTLLAREMLLNAEEFHRSAVVLTSATEAHTDTHLTNPMTVLFAFSAEMYLKSLIAFYGQSEVKGKKGHDLKFLFDEHVHEPARRVIKRTWGRIYSLEGKPVNRKRVISEELGPDSNSRC